jgi:hypothetical protein
VGQLFELPQFDKAHSSTTSPDYSLYPGNHPIPHTDMP